MNQPVVGPIPDITESFETRMLATMQRQVEDALEDVSPPPKSPSHSHLQTMTSDLHSPHTHSGADLSSHMHLTSESPATTSDDDTSFSTWKAPVGIFRIL